MYKALINVLKKGVICEIIAGIVGTLLMAFGYFVFEAFILSTVSVALLNVPWSLLQGGVGIAVAVALMRIIKKIKIVETAI